MNGLAHWMLGVTARLEDDAGDQDARGVFVPSMMGVGILVSLAILVADGLRALMPAAAESRARARRRRRAVGLVAPLAEAAGVPAPTISAVRRRLRPRWAYLGLFVAGVSLSLYVAIGSTENFRREGGYLEGVVWVEVLAIASSLLFLAVGLVGLAIARRYPLVPHWARPIVDHTPLGAREP